VNGGAAGVPSAPKVSPGPDSLSNWNVTEALRPYWQALYPYSPATPSARVTTTSAAGVQVGLDGVLRVMLATHHDHVAVRPQ
jgi:hypothetical protein